MLQNVYGLSNWHVKFSKGETVSAEKHVRFGYSHTVVGKSTEFHNPQPSTVTTIFAKVKKLRVDGFDCFNVSIMSSGGSSLNIGYDTKNDLQREYMASSIEEGMDYIDAWLEQYFSGLINLIRSSIYDRKAHLPGLKANRKEQVAVNMGELRSVRAQLMTENAIHVERTGYLLSQVAKNGRNALPADDSEALMIVLDLISFERKALEPLTGIKYADMRGAAGDLAHGSSAASDAAVNVDDVFSNNGQGRLSEEAAECSSEADLRELAQSAVADACDGVESTISMALAMILMRNEHDQVDDLIEDCWLEFQATMVDKIVADYLPDIGQADYDEEYESHGAAPEPLEQDPSDD